MAVKCWFCLGSSGNGSGVAEALAGLGRGRGEWGGHEGCQVSKCGMLGGRESRRVVEHRQPRQ